MPPVFNPWSPSSARLWSCAVGKSLAVLPSHKACSEISVPSSNSWMTMLAPAEPNALLTRISSMARSASDWLRLSSTPFPKARPSAFTAQYPFNDAAKALAFAASEKVPARAVGMPYFSMKFWENTFEDSNCAAFRFGPQIRKPCCWNRSTMPSARGLSGPTTVRSAFFSCANASNRGKSSAPIFTQEIGSPLARRSSLMPALPGVHHICVTCRDCASFQTSACSRPPEPMTRIFMVKLGKPRNATPLKAERRAPALREPEKYHRVVLELCALSSILRFRRRQSWCASGAWSFGRTRAAQIHFPALPIRDSNVVQPPESITPGPAIKRVIRRPEGDGVQAGFLRHFDRAFNRGVAVVPIEQQIFPLDQRLGQTARVAVINERLDVGVGLVEAAAMLILLEHLVVDSGDGKKQMACAQRGLALGVRV